MKMLSILAIHDVCTETYVNNLSISFLKWTDVFMNICFVTKQDICFPILLWSIFGLVIIIEPQTTGYRVWYYP